MEEMASLALETALSTRFCMLVRAEISEEVLVAFLASLRYVSAFVASCNAS